MFKWSNSRQGSAFVNSFSKGLNENSFPATLRFKQPLWLLLQDRLLPTTTDVF